MVTINTNNATTAPDHRVVASTAHQQSPVKFQDIDDDEEDDALLEQDDAHWQSGGIVSDPEVEAGRERLGLVANRKKRVRWIIDKDGIETRSPTTPTTMPAAHRRRTRSLSGDEIFNHRMLSTSWDNIPDESISIHQQQPQTPTTFVPQPAPVVMLDLPTIEGGWQNTPFSASNGIPVIIKRPTSDSLSKESPVKSTFGTFTQDPIVASPLAGPTLSLEESRSTPQISPIVRPAVGTHPMEPSPIEGTPTEIPTAPSSPLFPPLPTPAPSSSLITTIPKFTPPPNLVQSPRLAMIRTMSKDRPPPSSSSSSEFASSSSPRISPSTELHKHQIQPHIQDVSFKSALSLPSSRLSRPAHHHPHHHVISQQQHQQYQQQRPLNRRSLQAMSSASLINPIPNQATTQPSPPNPVSLTTSPRSPAGHSLSPHTPQSTILSPAPLPSISIMEDQDFSVPLRPDSPPWQTVGSGGAGAGVTSPRMKSSTHWRTEVLANSTINLIKSPPVTPFSSVHLQIDELPSEGDSDHESLRPPDPSPPPLPLTAPAPAPAAPLTPQSVASEPSPRPAILSPSPPKLLEPSTPPFKPEDELTLDQDQMERILQEAHVPWQSKTKESMGFLPVRKIVKRTERGEWDEVLTVDDIPRDSAHWKLVQAQRLWLKGNQEFFKLKHPSGLPRDHKTPKIQYIDGGEALRAIELLVQSILLDARVLAFKTPDARKDFMEQLAWQFFADARHTGWPDLVNIDYDLDEMFAKAELRAQGKGQFAQGGVISTRRSLASFVRNHVILATLEEEEGLTQAAVIRYGRALDIIDWVNQFLGPAPDKILYGRGDAKQRIEDVFDGVFGRGVQIRLGLTLISQYNYIKKDPACSSLRLQMLEELLSGARNLFESFEAHPMSPYVKQNLTLDVYISDYVYHVAYAFLFKGFYAKENAKLLLDMGQPSPVGGTPASEIARRRSKSSAQDLAQAALLFPEDEEERIQCFELALEEILKVGGLRVGEARAMYRSLKEGKVVTDRLWNHPADNGEDDAEDAIGLFDEGTTAAKKKKKKNKKKAKNPNGIEEAIVVVSAVAGEKHSPIIQDPATPKQSSSSPSTFLSPPPVQTPRLLPSSPPSTLSPHSLLLQSWFTALGRNLEEKRIMSGDVLHPARNLRGKPEVVWEEVVEDGDEIVDDGGANAGSIPWASWGMKSVKATKWEDLIREETTSKQEDWHAIKGKRSTRKSSGITPAAPAGRQNEDKPKNPDKVVETPTSSPIQLIAAIKASPTKAKKTEESPIKSSAVAPYEGPISIDPKQLSSENLMSISSVLAEMEASNSPKKTKTVQRDVKPAARHWDRPTPWAVIARISKERFFSLDLGVFDGNNVKK